MGDQDPDVAKYQAALKRSSFKVPRGAIVAVFGMALIAGGWGFAAWRESVKKEQEAAEKAREEKEQQALREKEREKEQSRLAPLEGAIKTYADVDPGALQEGPIELARGRRVLGIHTSWMIEDAEVRRILQMPDTGEKRRSLFLPGGADANERVAALAWRAEDVGTVVLVSSTSAPIGTYKDSDAPKGSLPSKPELKGYETRYSFVAFVVPERRVVARWSRVVLPPLTIQVTREGMPLGMSFGELEKADYIAYVDALFAGRAPAIPPPAGSAAR